MLDLQGKIELESQREYYKAVMALEEPLVHLLENVKEVGVRAFGGNLRAVDVLMISLRVRLLHELINKLGESTVKILQITEEEMKEAANADAEGVGSKTSQDS